MEFQAYDYTEIASSFNGSIDVIINKSLAVFLLRLIFHVK